MKIVSFQKLVRKLVNVLIAFCLLALNPGLVQTVQAAAGENTRASVVSSGAGE